MTIEELQELTDQEFKFVALDIHNNIMFAVPIPGVNAWKFDTEEEAQTFIWDDEEITACLDAWEKYIKTLPKKKNRTRIQAEKAGAITTMPTIIAIPTLKQYQYAISTVDDLNAHLQPVTSDLAVKLCFDDGRLYFQGVNASRVDLVQYYDKSPQAVSDLDLPTLRALYSIILKEVEDASKNPDKFIAQINDPQYLSHSVKIYLPDFLKMLGYMSNINKASIDAIARKITSYSNIVGVMREYQNGREYISHYPVMQLVCHDGKENTIQFSSPYMNKLIINILQASIEPNKRGNPKLKTSGEVFSLPSHSYLIKSSIAKEKNKRAVEIVCIVVTLIEQAGSHSPTQPHIKARTIIERCPDLKNAVEAARGGDKNKILKRAFSKAWELLPEQTELTKFYEGIVLPSPKNPKDIPDMKNLDHVFEFPHKGKRKKE